MIRNFYVSFVLVLISTFTSADSQLLGKVVKDDEICSLFYDGDKYIWFPKNVYVRSHFISKNSEFDGNNDGLMERIKLEENFKKNQTNMMYFGYEKQKNERSEKYKYIFPQSWMTCKNENSKCNMKKKLKSGILNIGVVPGKEKPVYYRSRYTNAFPFMRKGSTYYKVTTESTNKDVVSIIKPTPENQEYEVVCAFYTGKKL